MAQLTLTIGLVLGLAGCLGDSGGECFVDSDCSAGLLCSFPEGALTVNAADRPKGRCMTVDEQLKAFTDEPDTTTTPDAKPDAEPDVSADVDGCDPPAGSFSCDGPAQKKTVATYELASEGHGLRKIAGVGNPLILDAFDSGEESMELWIDGSLEAGCEYRVGWVRSPSDVGADCQPKFTDELPFTIPSLVNVVIHDAVFHAEDDTVTGYVIEQEVLDSMDPALRETGATLITEDLDLDEDGTVDAASVLMKVVFE